MFRCGVPWKDQRVMSQKLQFIEKAGARGANISALCREFGVTPRHHRFCPWSPLSSVASGDRSR
jgi:hypothetical protein